MPPGRPSPRPACADHWPADGPGRPVPSMSTGSLPRPRPHCRGPPWHGVRPTSQRRHTQKQCSHSYQMPAHRQARHGHHDIDDLGHNSPWGSPPAPATAAHSLGTSQEALASARPCRRGGRSLNQHGNVPMEIACRNHADRMKIRIVTPADAPGPRQRPAKEIHVITGKEYVPESAKRSGRKPSPTWT